MRRTPSKNRRLLHHQEDRLVLTTEEETMKMKKDPQGKTPVPPAQRRTLGGAATLVDLLPWILACEEGDPQLPEVLVGTSGRDLADHHDQLVDQGKVSPLATGIMRGTEVLPARSITLTETLHMAQILTEIKVVIHLTTLLPTIETVMVVTIEPLHVTPPETQEAQEDKVIVNALDALTQEHTDVLKVPDVAVSSRRTRSKSSPL